MDSKLLLTRGNLDCRRSGFSLENTLISPEIRRERLT